MTREKERTREPRAADRDDEENILRRKEKKEEEEMEEEEEEEGEKRRRREIYFYGRDGDVLFLHDRVFFFSFP